MDIETAFLSSPLPEEKQIFVQQPLGFEELAQDGMPLVCQLQRTLYGLKQSPRYWYKTLRAVLVSMGLTRLEADHYVVVGKIPGSRLEGVIVLVYVDDLLITGPKSGMITLVKVGLQAQFNIKDQGPVKFFLGIRVQRDGSNYSTSLY